MTQADQPSYISQTNQPRCAFNYSSPLATAPPPGKIEGRQCRIRARDGKIDILEDHLMRKNRYAAKGGVGGWGRGRRLMRDAFAERVRIYKAITFFFL